MATMDSVGRDCRDFLGMSLEGRPNKTYLGLH